MDKKDKLHELIRSMSMAEKRRFTIDASQHTSGKERKYILLFDVMVEMKEYHTEACQVELSGWERPRRELGETGLWSDEGMENG